MEQKGWGRFKTKVALLDFPSWRDLPSQDCYFINNSYGNEGQGRTRFSHKLDVAMNVSLCLPWPCCGIRHCLLGPEGQTQRKKWKASTFLHGTQRQQEKGRGRGRKDRMNPISLPLAFFFLAVWYQHFLQVTLSLGHSSSNSVSTVLFSSKINNHILGFRCLHWKSGIFFIYV